MIDLPEIPEIPENPCGHEIAGTEARRLIEIVSIPEYGMTWGEFRLHWNHARSEHYPQGLTDDEREQLRPLARLLQYAVVP